MITKIPQEQLTNEMEVAERIIDKLGYVTVPMKLDAGIFVDQDGWKHLVFKKSDKTDKETLEKYYRQLRDVYSYSYLTGDICMTRSRATRVFEQEFNDLYQRDIKVDSITIASIIQIVYYSPNDMQLMSRLMHWFYTGC